MKQSLDKRLRKPESEYAAELDSQTTYQIAWLMENRLKCGMRPGLYDLPAKAGDSPVVGSADPQKEATDLKPYARIETSKPRVVRLITDA
jgi:hypothetical protein